MRYPGTLVFALVLAALPACGSTPAPATPDAVPEPSAAEEPAAAEGAPAGDAAEPAGQAAAAPEGAAPSEAEDLARDFVKKGGRRIGYSASKKSFAYPLEQRRADGFRLDVIFTDEEGRKKDVLQICDFVECAEKLDELAKALIPKLASRLEGDGYVAIRGIGWPSGRDELEVGTLGMKLRYSNGRLEALREGKPAVTLGQVKSQELLAVFVIPDVKRLGVFAKSGGSAVQDFHVVKLP